MYNARPIRRWVKKNVITKLSELLVHEEAGEGSAIHIDAMGDKGLKYEVVKKATLDLQEDKDVNHRRRLKRRRGLLSSGMKPNRLSKKRA